MNPDPATTPRLGIDISKLSFDACLHLPDATIRAAAFPNNAQGFAKLDAWLQTHVKTRPLLAGLEATGSYGTGLLWHLHTQGHRLYLLNPRWIKNFARSQGRRVKTDSQDAALIAAYLKSADDLQPWQPPAQALAELQALVRRRAQLLDDTQAQRNRLEALHDSASAMVAASLKRQIKQLEAELKRIEDAIDKHLLQHPALQHSMRLLQSIDGIGRVVAMTILAEVPVISAFDRARDLAAFSGLTPALAQSGTSLRRRGAMTKQGSAALRKQLYMAALQAAKRTNNAFHKSFCDFVERGKSKMCALGAIMHKLIRVAFGVLKHNTPFIKNFARL